MSVKKIFTPLTKEVTCSLKSGDEVLISGILITARDRAHKLICEQFRKKDKFPVNLKGQIIYYTGPAPARLGSVIGSTGPTTSSRMDKFTPLLIRKGGLSGMIGKGNRSPEVIKAIKDCGAVYFAAIGGCGALLSKNIIKAETLLYHKEGPEAVLKLTVKDFPAVVAIDSREKSIYDKKK
jgi:fumarate hydratase subunit beta